MPRRLNSSGLIAGLCVALILGLLLAVGSGPISIDPLLLLNSLFASSDSAGDAKASQYATIVQHIRLPRAILAALVGAGLAASGAAMQGLFRNPLADPSLIGVSSGAMMGASIIIVLGSGFTAGNTLLGLTAVAAGAFAGGAISALLVYRLATGVTGTSVATMLLAGIAITALAGSVSSLLEFISDNEMLRRISLWRMGGLDGASWQRVGIAAVAIGVLLVLLPRYSVALNALLLGESEARHLGLNVQSLKRELILLVAFGVGIAVALAGTIAFVGLVVPHIVRMLIGPDHRSLIPASALAGAVLLLIADAFARTIIAPTELPIGVVTAVLGTPFFISLLRQRHEYGMR